MELLANYGDSDDDTSATAVKKAIHPPVKFKSLPVNSAPSVQEDLRSSIHLIDPTSKVVKYNPTAEQMWTPLQGPVNPADKSTQLGGQKQNCVTGHVDKTYIDNFVFEEQLYTFQSYGYAIDPTNNPHSNGGNITLVDKLHKGDEEKVKAGPEDRPTVFTSNSQQKKLDKEKISLRKKRKLHNDDSSDIDNFKGPWASYLWEEEIKELPELNEEQKEYVKAQAEKKQRAEKESFEFEEEWSEFHGKENKDYQNRSWLHPKNKIKDNQLNKKCFIPKKWIHTWSGHKKGVTAIRWFPGTGHLLLSASNDSTVKIWDVEGNKKCLRTYHGHDQAVRDICFANDGKRFISCGYDKFIKNWDTETGQCISRHTSRRIPYCIKLHPNDSRNNNEFLAGQSNKLIVQWDMRCNEITQKYDEHLGAVNTITFVDNNRRFVTTSDDKKAFIWEYGIPVVLKHIAEPDMHSMPAVCLHPSGKWWLGQSQDNQVLVYGALNRFSQNRKKSFRGHLTAGYACQISMSPDGRFVMSGDAEGRVFFWDWKTQKCYKRLKAHDQVAIGAIWHPIHASRVATCSWDGLIKYWD